MSDFLGVNIEYLRKKAGLTQEQLGEKIEVKKTTISGYEKNRILPPLDKCLALADLFEVNIDDLLNKNIAQLNSAEFQELSGNFERRLSALESRLNTNPTDEDEATLHKLVKLIRDKYPDAAKELGL